MKVISWSAVLFVAGNVMASSMAQTHDGFFLNMAVGFASGGMQKISEEGKIDYTGSTSLANFRIGGCPIPDLAVSADFQTVTLGRATKKIEGESENLDRDFQMTALSIAIGVTYYIPDLLFVGANFAPAGELSFSDTDENESFKGDMLGYSFRIGREWWVSENWGLGVEWNYTYSKLSDVDLPRSDDADWITHTYGILFTATFN